MASRRSTACFSPVTLCKHLARAHVVPVAIKQGSPVYRMADIVAVLHRLPAEDAREDLVEAQRDLRRWLVRALFFKAEPLARLLTRQTHLSPRKVLDLIDIMYAMFGAYARRVLAHDRRAGRPASRSRGDPETVRERKWNRTTGKDL